MPDSPSRTSPTLDQLKRYAEEFNVSQTLKMFGVRVSFPSVELVVVELDPVTLQHRGGLGTNAVNGGVLAAMFDLVIGCTPALLDPTRRTATMQLSMSFERPLFGDRVRAEGQVTSAGAKTIFAVGRILDEHGNVCARCNGVVRMSNLPWESGGSPAIN